MLDNVTINPLKNNHKLSGIIIALFRLSELILEIMAMTRTLRATLFGVTATLALTTAAFAGPIDPTLSIGYSINGGTTQTLTSGQGIVTTGPINTSYDRGTITGQTDFGQSVNFDLSIAGGARFTTPITVYLTESDLTGADIQSIEGNLTNNTIAKPAATSIEYALYGSSTDQLYGGTFLASVTLGGTNSGYVRDGAFDTGSGLYSITQAITITPSATGITNVSFDGTVNVPEPGSLAVLGTGLLALGLMLRKRQKRG